MDLYCKIYVNSCLGIDGFRSILADLDPSLLAEGVRSLSTGDYEIDIVKNPPLGDEEPHVATYLGWPLALEIWPKPGCKEGLFKAAVSSLLQLLWKNGIAAVAACDFESDLPNQGAKEVTRYER